MRGRFLYACVLLLLGGCLSPVEPLPEPAPDPVPSPAPAPTPYPSPDPSNAVAKLLLDLHNAERSKHGLKPLVLNAKLTEAAQKHSDFQAKVNRMAHFGIGDGDPWARIRATGYQYGYAGENVAGNQADAASVVKDWMWSPGHRANILSSRYTEFGGGMADAGHGPYWTTDFASPGGAESGAEPGAGAGKLPEVVWRSDPPQVVPLPFLAIFGKLVPSVHLCRCGPTCRGLLPPGKCRACECGH